MFSSPNQSFPKDPTRNLDIFIQLIFSPIKNIFILYLAKTSSESYFVVLPRAAL